MAWMRFLCRNCLSKIELYVYPCIYINACGCVCVTWSIASTLFKWNKDNFLFWITSIYIINVCEMYCDTRALEQMSMWLWFWLLLYEAPKHASQPYASSNCVRSVVETAKLRPTIPLHRCFCHYTHFGSIECRNLAFFSPITSFNWFSHF